mgnify:CR=1 FL=1
MMKQQNIKQKVLKTCLIAVSSLVLSACGNLNYPDTQTYYDTFGDNVELYYTNEANEQGTDDASISESFYNDKTANNPSLASVVDSKYYEYLFLEVSVDDFAMENFGLYFKGDGDLDAPIQNLEVNIYTCKAAEKPVFVRGYWGPKVPSGDDDPDDYDDKWGVPLASGIANITNGKWSSLVIEEWTINEAYASSVPISNGDFLVIHFINNTGYGFDKGLKPVFFTATNLLVSKFDPNGESELIDSDNPDDDIWDDDYDDSGEDDFIVD